MSYYENKSKLLLETFEEDKSVEDLVEGAIQLLKELNTEVYAKDELTDTLFNNISTITTTILNNKHTMLKPKSKKGKKL